MSEQKPLRQEDYMAMAEENKRLQEELGKLKKPEPSDERGWFDKHGWIFPAICFVSLCVLFFGGLARIVSHDEKDEKEKTEAPVCYVTAQANTAQPWDQWHIWEMRRGREVAWEKVVKSFDSQEDADKWFSKWKLNYCGKSWESWPKKHNDK